MLSRYITYFPLNDVTYTFRQGGKKPEISKVMLIIVFIVIVNVID